MQTLSFTTVNGHTYFFVVDRSRTSLAQFYRALRARMLGQKEQPLPLPLVELVYNEGHSDGA